jgi:predicted acetyltransferase
LRCYLLCENGTPVSTSTLFLGAGVAGIYDVATLPSVRGRGYGSAITTAPALDAGALGYPIVVLQASSKGLPVYERLGFRTVCQIEHFAWKAPDGPR